MDEFGHDPQVRRMREIFRALETWEQESARNTGLHWTDPRLGLIRRKVLAGFLPELNRALFSGPAEAVEIYARVYRDTLRELEIGNPAAPLGRDEDA